MKRSALNAASVLGFGIFKDKKIDNVWIMD